MKGERNGKDMKCKCGRVVKNVDSKAVSVVCWECAMPDLKKTKNGK